MDAPAAAPAAVVAQAPIGIIAGGGSLPVEIAESLASRGRRVHIVGITGSAGPEIEAFPHSWTRIAAIGRLLGSLRAAGCREIVFVGRITRPDVRALRPDLGFFRHLPMFFSILRDGDDAILTRIISFFERQGFTVLGVPEVAPELVARKGTMGRHAITAEDLADAGIGAKVIAAIGPLDVGQAVVVRRGRVMAIEAAEGTDRMLARAAELRGGAADRCGVLVKRPKPGQELRIDLPAIGPPTIAGAEAAGLSAIAVAPGGALLLERARLIAEADARGIAVTGLDAPGAAPDRQVRAVTLDPVRGRVGRAAARELALAAEVVARLSDLGCESAVAVSRGHVLAVSAAEGPVAMLARVRAQRQWGDAGSSRRRGVTVLGHAGADCDPAALRDGIDRAGLAAIAVTSAWPAAAVQQLLDRLPRDVAVSMRRGG